MAFDATNLCDRLPDLPRWVEVRSELLRGSVRIFGSMSDDGSVVVSTRAPLAQIIGHPPKSAMDAAIHIMPTNIELLVVPEDIEHARELLPGWREHHAVLHTLTEPVDPTFAESHVIDTVDLFDEIDDDAFWRLPKPLSDAAQHALIAAAKRANEHYVSICHTGAITETLWDVGIDTLPEFRRQGHATDCYHALAAHLARIGRQPVWGALKTNESSLAMADSLGFVPKDEIIILLRPDSSVNPRPL